MNKIYNFNRAFAAEDITQGDAENTISFSVASSEPYIREDKNGKKFAEVLEISEAAIDFSRLVDNRAPLLFEHDRERQLGVVEKAWIANNKLYVQCKFSSNGFPQSILKDVKDNIRRNVSIGYQVLEFSFDRGIEDGVPVMNVVRWLPLECSIVSIPADATVGIGRALESVDDELDTEDKACEETAEEKKACDIASSEEEKKEDESTDDADHDEDCKEATPEDTAQAPEEKACGEDEEATKELDPEDDEDEEAKARLAEIEEIRSLAELTNTKDLAEKYVSENRSLDEFKTAVKELNNNQERNVSKENKPTMEKKFNLLRALRNHTSLASEDAMNSYEMEVERSVKEKYQIKDSKATAFEFANLRALPADDTALRPAEYRPDLYTGILYPESVIAKTGATSVAVTGRSITFPVQLSGAAASFVGLNSPVPSGSQSFAEKTLTPKKVGCYVDIPYESFLQDDPAIEGIVVNDLVKNMSVAIDEGIIAGDGTGYNPTGLTATSGMNEVAASGMFSLSGVQEFEEKIRESNDYSTNLTWVMNWKNYYKFMRTQYYATAENKMLLDPDTRLMLGHPVAICNKLDDDTVVLGDFTNLVVANFDGITLRVMDDATLGVSQTIRCIAHAAVDVCVRRPKSFTISKA